MWIEKLLSETYAIFLINGPRAGSYNPPSLGFPYASKVDGLTTCLTEIDKISSVDKIPNRTVRTSAGTASEIFMPGAIIDAFCNKLLLPLLRIIKEQSEHVFVGPRN